VGDERAHREYGAPHNIYDTIYASEESVSSFSFFVVVAFPFLDLYVCSRCSRFHVLRDLIGSASGLWFIHRRISYL
jgi:hypothetical protein